MAATAGTATEIGQPGPRPIWLSIIAGFSLLLGIITGVPQLYYVLFAIQPHVFPIGPHSNPLGEVWFYYILHGHQGGYLEVDAGTLAGAIEDAFMLAPLYIVTGLGLLRRRSWVIPVGLMTGAIIFYAILYFALSGILASHADQADIMTTVWSSVPYLVYPLWLIPVLLLRRSLFSRAQPVEQRVGGRSA